MSAAFQTQQLSDDVRPLKVANRDAFVFPSYRRRMAEHADENAVVTYKGKPIVRGGETLLLGMVPLERRYAIGPVEMGQAELLSQYDFEQAHERAYIDEYAMKGQPADNVKWRYIPNVVDFVAWKIDPTNSARITTLGFQPDKTAQAEPVAAPSEIESLRTEKDLQAVKLDEMQRKIDELSALMSNKPKAELQIEAVEPKTETAPCGKEIKTGFLAQHQRFCKKQGCYMAPVE